MCKIEGLLVRNKEESALESGSLFLSCWIYSQNLKICSKLRSQMTCLGSQLHHLLGIWGCPRPGSYRIKWRTTRKCVFSNRVSRGTSMTHSLGSVAQCDQWQGRAQAHPRSNFQVVFHFILQLPGLRRPVANQKLEHNPLWIVIHNLGNAALKAHNEARMLKWNGSWFGQCLR